MSAGLDQIAAGYRDRGPTLGAAAGVSLEIILGRLADHFDWTRKQSERAARAAMMFPFPAQLYPVTNGVPGVPTFVADANAPKDGYTWFAARLSVDGLVGGVGAPAFAQGQQAAPAANTTIATVAAAAITPGVYSIGWSVGLSGTLAAAEIDNFRLRLGSTTLATSSNPDVAGQFPQLSYGPILLTGANSVNIINPGIATAGSIYDASISLTPSPGDQVQLYRGPALAVAAQPQNRIHTFTAPGSGGPGPDWTPGGRGLLMPHHDALTLAGSGLAAAQLVLSGDVICIEDWVLTRYLAGIG